MAIAGIDPKCYILALFVRDDGVRFLLGDDPYEFKDKQLHFQPNTVANDVVEVQGNDGYLLAGQVRRPGTQSFDGYVCNGTNSKAEVEVKRREFLQFFRRSHFYKVIYVFPNGTAIQRKQGFLVDDPTVQELYQQYPEYHVALNFEDVNYYTYEEDDQGQEIYAKEAIVPLAGGGATGGLIWDEYGVVWEDPWSDLVSVSGTEIQIENEAGARAPIQDLELQGDTYQQTYSGKNLFNINGAVVEVSATRTVSENALTATMSSTGGNKLLTIEIPNSSGLLGKTVTLSYTLKNISGANSARMSMYFGTLSNPAHYVIFDGTIKGSSSVGENVERTVTIPDSFPTSGQSIFIVVYANTNTTSISTIESVEYSNIQLEIGSVTAYEPFVGGIPAPNPDYPQDVQTATGVQTVDLYGKNLFNVTSTTRTATRNGVKITIADDGMITLDGKSTGATWPDIIWGISGNTTEHSACKYYFPRVMDNAVFSLKYVSGTASGGSITIRFNDSGDVDANISFTSPDTTSAVQNISGINRAYITQLDTGVTFDNFSFYVQVEEGTATSFEPYQSQSYIIDLRGKNLLNISDFAMGGLSNGNPTTSSYRIQNADHPIAVQPNTTYTLSAQLVSPVQGFRVGVHECGANGSFISDSGWKQLYVPNTFTTGPNTYYLKMVGSLSTTSTNVSTGGTENTTACTTVTEFMRGCTLMLEEGSSATTYQPYNPIELCKIGDYQDYIYNNGDDWYVHKETGKMTSTSASLVQYQLNTYHKVTRPSNAIRSHPSVVTATSNMGAGVWEDQTWNSPIVGLFTHASGNDWWLGFGRVVTNEEAAEIIGKGCIIYYALSTPIDTKITDATLIGQLEALGAMRLFIGENNLLVSATGTNLPATLEFSYPTKFATIGAEWEEGGTKGATIVNVNAIDNTYPVWELMGPAVNPTISVLTTNTTLTYNGTITASQKLVIDMFNKTATLNGTSVIGNVSGDFVYMAPGTNRIAYTAENTDAPDSTIYWQEVVG